MEFRLKSTSFFNRPVAIICQNENGPCPLIAIANILSLQGKIAISVDRSFISLDEVIQLVADEIFRVLESNVSSPNTDLDESQKVQRSQTMQDVFNVLPKLARGLDLNIGFKAVNKYEFTEEISIFDALSIPLVHGWLYDPGDSITAEVVGDLSYNHLLYKMVEYRTLLDSGSNTPEPTEVPNPLLAEGPVIDAFLTQTASQLTYTGLLKLYEFMNDRQLAVFFRNNHFSTLFAFNGQLFLLVTDLGYLQQPVVWELLNSVNGGSEFYNEAFVPISELPFALHDTPQPSPRPILPHEGQGTVCLPPGQTAPSLDAYLTQPLGMLSPPPLPSSGSAGELLAMQLQAEEEQLSLAIQMSQGTLADQCSEPVVLGASDAVSHSSPRAAPTNAVATAPTSSSTIASSANATSLSDGSHVSSHPTTPPTALGSGLASPPARNGDANPSPTLATPPNMTTPPNDRSVHSSTGDALQMSQEELDHQLALMAFYEEKRLEQARQKAPSPRHSSQTAVANDRRVAPHPRPPRQQLQATNSQTSSSGCILN